MEGGGGGAREGSCTVEGPERVKLAPGPALPLAVSAALALAYIALQGSYWALIALSMLAVMTALEVAEALQAVRAIHGSRLKRCARGSLESIEAEVLLEAPGLKGPLELVDRGWSRQLEPPPILALEGLGVFKGSYTLKAAPGLSESRGSRLLWHTSLALLAVEATYNILVRAPVKPAPHPASLPPVEAGVEAGAARLGAGVEVEVVREWTPWDDARRIHWSASARAGRLMVWEGPPEAGVRLHVFIDLSRPAWRGSPGSTGADRAMRLAVGLADSVASSGGVLGYTIYTGGGWLMRHPEPAREAYVRFVEALSWTRLDDSASPGPSAVRALREALEAASSVGARLVVLASSPSLCSYLAEAGFEGVVVEGCGPTLR